MESTDECFLLRIRMSEKKGNSEKVKVMNFKVNHFTQSNCRMPSLSRTPLLSPCSALGTGGLGACAAHSTSVENDFFNLRISKMFFGHVPQTQFPSYGHTLSIFSDIKGSIELTIIFFRVLA